MTPQPNNRHACHRRGPVAFPLARDQIAPLGTTPTWLITLKASC